MVKVQTGIRLDVQLWHGFKAVCEKSRFRPNEAIEAFLRACVERQDVESVLNALKCQSPSQRLAYELSLKKELMKLQIEFDVDTRLGETENFQMVREYISAITEILPLINDQQLLSKTQSSVEKALEYYGPRVTDEEEAFRRREKLWEQETEDQQ